MYPDCLNLVLQANHGFSRRIAASVLIHLHVCLNGRYGPRSSVESKILDRDDEIVPVAGSDLDSKGSARAAQSQHLVHMSRKLHDYRRFIHHRANARSSGSASSAAPSAPGLPVLPVLAPGTSVNLAPSSDLYGQGELQSSTKYAWNASVLGTPSTLSILFQSSCW